MKNNRSLINGASWYASLACTTLISLTLAASPTQADDVRVAVRPEFTGQAASYGQQSYPYGDRSFPGHQRQHRFNGYRPHNVARPSRYDDLNAPSQPTHTQPRYPVTPNPVTPTDTLGSYRPQSPTYDAPNDGAPSYGAPTHPEPTIEEELTYRYTDSKMIGFLRSTSMSKLASMYMEVSQYIDQRHVNPASYEVRTARALDSLISAVEHPAFLQAAGASGNNSAVRQVQAELQSLKTRQVTRSSQEAIGVMQYAASLVSRSMGVRPEAVAMEFINGTVDSLDRYSAYNPTSLARRPGARRPDVLEQSAGLEEHIVGIGIELKAHDNGVLIVGVIDNGPAAAAKLQRGDVITGIDGRSLAGMNLNQAADLITGPVGSRVGLDVQRDGRQGRVTLPRRRVYVSSVTNVHMIDSTQGVAYLRLKQFSESSNTDLDKALWKLHQQGMKTLVMDLRGNPGGLLDQAIDISNKFITSGNIVATKGRNPQDNTLETASFDRTWKVPLVVLVDENSASASEIFAAAIQDNQRGVIVGRNSYGKGTVQTHFPLRSVGGDLKLTTAKFYSPQGREMAGSGVRPDIAVPEHQAGLDKSPERDGDIQMALRIAQDGRAADLATRSGRNNINQTGYSNSL